MMVGISILFPSLCKNLVPSYSAERKREDCAKRDE
jgi:hypothetical protein